MFRSDPPAMSASDIQQVLKRYTNFCTPRTDMIYCEEPVTDPAATQYYFPFQECDGFSNCANDADEGFDQCGDMGCGQSVLVSGSGSQVDLHGLDGVYHFYQEGHNNGRPVYKRDNPHMFLYSFSGNSYWHFHRVLDDAGTLAWTHPSTCPTDKLWRSLGFLAQFFYLRFLRYHQPDSTDCYKKLYH